MENAKEIIKKEVAVPNAIEMVIMMESKSLNTIVNEKANLIWAIADKLTGVYKPHEYGEVILPLTVIRRFDCILMATKDKVLENYDKVKNLDNRDEILKKASGFGFYNTCKYNFDTLLEDSENIKENLFDYLNAFSENVRDMINVIR